jgi:cytochrome c oxidase cbb3-type subunit III
MKTKMNPEDPIRPHVYDGIAEYDKCLPNWWLYTLYATIVFSAGYWAYYEWFRVGPSSHAEVSSAMAKIETARLASAAVDDASLWKMSQNETFVRAGRATYEANCAACHLASMKGKSESPAAIGPDLTDAAWLHGGRPSEVYNVITQGVSEKGMPAWGPMLGPKKISELTAFIFSQHNEGDPAAALGAPITAR